MRPARIFAPATLTVGMFTLTACGLFGNAAEPASTATPSATDETSVARVLRVIDADTLSIERDGTTITVDLLGLVTPQAKHENEDMRCLAPEAADYLAKLVPIGSPVTLTYDEALGMGETSQPDPSVSPTITVKAAVTLPDGRMLNTEMARAGFGVAIPEGGSTLYDTISAAQDQADQQAGIYSRTIDCTLPARLNSTLTSINNAQGMDLKEPLEAADSLTRRLEEYETSSDLPLLSAIAQTQSVKTLRDTLLRARDSKRIVYNLAEEAERERLENEKAEKDGKDQPTGEATQLPAPDAPSAPDQAPAPEPTSVNPDTTHPGDTPHPEDPANPTESSTSAPSPSTAVD
ncbi:thermonuclease family protein [Rothia nasimurium]|uniref:thermonuclease family protein n=1 Tax=Rothia nasimurium TaxID=85336 RepID=UPI0036244A5B